MALSVGPAHCYACEARWWEAPVLAEHGELNDDAHALVGMLEHHGVSHVSGVRVSGIRVSGIRVSGIRGAKTDRPVPIHVAVNRSLNDRLMQGVVQNVPG